MSVAWVEVLPTLNASLNGTCAVLLLAGRGRIRRGERLPHMRFMLAAVATSVVFLVSYLTRVALTGRTVFVGPPLLRLTYLLVLGTHTICAILVVPLVLTTLVLALRGRFARHRRLARITYPVWLYVSVTGVIVYVMLYHLATARLHPA